MSKQDSTVLFDALGPRGRRRVLIASIITSVTVIALVGYAALVLAERDFFSPLHWATVFDARMFQEVWVYGLIGTLRAAILGSVGAIVLGILVGLGRVSRYKTLRGITAVYVQFFRAMPLLLLIWIPFTLNLFFDFMGPILGSNDVVTGTFFVVLALSVYNAAILAEILRSGINALPPGQAMAGESIGLTHGQNMRLIVLPQALRNMLPAVLAQLVILFKDTALGYIITYPELLHEARLLGKSYGSASLQALVTAALVYFIIAYTMSKLVVVVERRLSRKTAAKPVQATTVAPTGGTTGG